MALDLVSYSDLKSLLGLDKSAIDDYPSLGVINISVYAAIEEYLGRSLEEMERTEVIFIGNIPSQMVSLTGLPIESVDSVSIIDSTDSSVSYTDSDYYITGYGIKLSSKVKNAKVTVTYTGGITTVPGNIARAALIQTAYEFQNKEHIGAESVSTDGGMVSSPSLALLKEVKRVLTSQMHPLKWC